MHRVMHWIAHSRVRVILLALAAAGLLLWFLRPKPAVISPVGTVVTPEMINRDARILLLQHGASAVSPLYRSHQAFMKLAPGAGNPDAQLVYVQITNRDGRAEGTYEMAAEHAVRTWLYLSRRTPSIPIAAVTAAVTPRFAIAAGRCAYISQDKFNRLVRELGESEAAVPEMARRIWTGDCGIDNAQMLEHDRQDDYRRP